MSMLDGLFSVARAAVSRLSYAGGAYDKQQNIAPCHTTENDGGGGVFEWRSLSTTAADGGTVVAVSGVTVGRWHRLYSGHVNAAWFGAFPDGATECNAPLTAALATGKPVFLPAGSSYYKVTGTLDVTTGGLIGEHKHDSGSGTRTKIVFGTCTSTSRGALRVPQSGSTNGLVRIENLTIAANSWDGTTGCLGYGVELEARARLLNVAVEGFKKSNIWLHHDMSQNGPYESSIENVISSYSGVHGMLIGNGANALCLKNYSGKWNGCTSFGVAPTATGTGDGLKVSNTADGGAWPAYTPEALSIRGGDCSYNAGYGWNIDVVSESFVTTGYCEGNYTDQVRVGQVVRTRVQITQMAAGTTGFTDGMSYGPYYYESSVWYGAKRLAPVDDYQFVTMPTANDESSGTIAGSLVRKVYLSRSTTAAHLTWLAANETPDGTAITTATETVATIRGYGTAALGIGSGSRHLKITDNTVRLPDAWYWATATGWAASNVVISRGSAAPVAGAQVVGSIVFNSAPASAGYIGWVCTVAGTPGTWVGFGVIA